MRVEDFDLISRTVKERAGIVLTRDKVYLLESRLMPVARRYGMKSLTDIVQSLRTRPDERLLRDVVDAMTTNESLFFRDIKPFDQLREKVLPPLMKARAAGRSIRIWCAACSTGQEPYSIAILLKELGAKVAGWRFEIIGTDISREVVERARAGTYSQFEVQRGLPITLLVKYFKQEGDRWEISRDIRSMVTFREFNLLTPMRSLGRFDIVFCRNVLIYFDTETKGKVLGGIREVLAPDGVLYLGGAETVIGVTEHFVPVSGERGIYQISDKPSRTGATPGAGRFRSPPQS